MAATTPPIYTGIHEAEIVENNELQSFTEETLKKLGLNNNWLIDLRPIGSIIFANINQPGAEIPDKAIYQECDGSEIVEPNSPLRSIGVNTNFTPNLEDRYIRFADSLSGNIQEGSQEHSLQHSHTTGGPSSVGSGMQEKGDRRYRVSHNHAVATQYGDSTTFNSPAYVYMIAYMKIV